jgi:hypothetical protein
MLTAMPLTKSEFIRGLDCEKRLWLDRYRPDLKSAPSLSSIDRMVTGMRVGKFAHNLYPNGKFPGAPGDNHIDAYNSTLIGLESGHDCLFEATLISGGRLARLDVLSKRESDAWTLDEVKSSTLKEPKELKEQITDLAFQVVTAKGAGIKIEAARLVLIDTSYVWRGGEFDPASMLSAIDLTSECEAMAGQVEDISSNLIKVLNSESEPEVEKNTHCKKCDYFGYCHRGSPKNDLIFLPKILPKVVRQLRDKGYERIEDIPDTEKLTDARRRMRDVIVSGEPFVGEGLREAIDSIVFPAIFVDFESTNPAFPMYVGTRPYQQICFQWSAHILKTSNYAPEHHEFLANDCADPRTEFCRSLWEIVKHCQGIIHYAKFEITQLKLMVADNVPLAAELLQAFETRATDLEEIILDHTYFEGYRGKSSIKVVLPTLVPTMSYKEMLIADGMAAAVSFRKMIDERTSAEESSTLRTALLDYCCQDTLAMVEIYLALRLLS